jgi:phosphonate transport system substrate-binding protein
MFGAPRVFRLIFAIVGLVLSVDGAARADPVGSADERESTFIIGRISPDPRRTLPRLDAMAGYMAAKLQDAGYRRGVGLVVADIAEMVRLMRQGQVDMVSESPRSAVQIADAAGAEIALREWKDKVPVYRGVIVVARRSPVQSLADLRGRRIAFEDRGSTSGYLLPLMALRAAGIPAVELATPDAPVPPDTAGYIFSGGELNIATWTARGLVDAGAYSDLDLEDTDRTPKRMRSELRVVHLSEPVIRSVVLLRGDLPPERHDKVMAALLAIGTDETADDVRHQYYRLRRYDALDAQGRRSLDAIRGALAAIGAPEK